MEYFNIIVIIVIILATLLVAYSIIISGIKQATANVKTDSAKVLGKRQKMSNFSDSTIYTSYYITFELSDKSRVELLVESNYYGLLIEGDVGKLTYKGMKLISFEKNNYQ